MLAWHEVFRLQLIAAAGRKPHSEMWQPFMPRPRHSQLRSTVLRGDTPDRMYVYGSCLRTEERRSPGEVCIILRPDLDPYAVDIPVTPARKKTHAITRRHDFIEMMFQRSDRQLAENILPHRI